VKMARRVRTGSWPAPVRGLLKAGAVAQGPADAAEVLDNFIPTAEGARLRGGIVQTATVPAAVVALMVFRSGAAENLFAATASAVYDVTAPADPLVSPAAAFSGLIGGDWSFTQFATAAGQFLVIANGTDSVRHYNGSVWATPAITGVTSSDLSFVWAHKSRLWFIENSSLSAWYLPVNSIAGAAVEFPLDGVFRLGGRLLFGGTLSSDAGDGRDDSAIFVTSEGEVAVYQGTDPSSASTWDLTGVYRIGKPLNKKAWFRVAGDTAVLTEDGIVSIMQAMTSDRTGLQPNAITAPIEDFWQKAIATRSTTSPFPATVWPTRTIALIGVPSASAIPVALVANTRTGAWARITGWAINALALLNDQVMFGTPSGQIVRADSGGDDLGVSYTGIWVPKFQEFNPTETKFALRARAMWRSITRQSVRLVCFQNYALGTYPASDANTVVNPLKWGAAVKWGARKWGGSNTIIEGSDWQSVTGSGYALAPALVVSTNGTASPGFELAGMQLRYETGRPL
jgi:hypothetical protein